MEDMKSDGAIKTDVYRYINESGFMSNVNGKLSKTMRPHNSHKEDVVISILANEGTQLQTAIINVNIYIQDQDVDGQSEENTIRLEEICIMAWNLLETFRTGNTTTILINKSIAAIYHILRTLTKATTTINITTHHASALLR